MALRTGQYIITAILQLYSSIQLEHGLTHYYLNAIFVSDESSNLCRYASDLLPAWHGQICMTGIGKNRNEQNFSYNNIE